MKKVVMMLTCVMIIIVFSACGGGDAEETAVETTEATVVTTTTTEKTAEVETTTSEVAETTTTKSTTQTHSSSKPEYDAASKYLSNYRTTEGNGYVANVDSSIKGNFTELRNCAMYLARKGYEQFGTMDMGIFGYFDGDTSYMAFGFDGASDTEITIFEEPYDSPKGWQWVLVPSDIEYIKGNE